MGRRTVILILFMCGLLASCATPATTVVPNEVQLSTDANAQFASVQIGFDPQRDGFSFRNYGANADISNLTNSDMQRLFGDAVCMVASKSCTLIPAARIWMEEINRAMQTGHCEGMAVLSQYFYYGVINPKMFGGDSVAALQLTDNPPLQREIAYWWATQATFPTRAHRVVTDPVEAVDLLRAGLHKDADVAQLYTIGIYQTDFNGGHTVTPIGLRDIDVAHVAIQIYDNNIPNETREIIVDTAKNTWTYTATNVDGVAQSYAGDRTSKTIELTAAAPRLQKQVCHFCPSNPVAQGVDDLTTFFFSSSATAATAISQQFSAYFVDGLGRRVGIVLGKVYNEIPNAQIGFLRGAPEQWSPLGMPMLSVPASVNGSLRITGLQNVPINVTAFGKGKVVALQNLLVDATVASEIRLDQVGSTVAIASGTQSSPDIYVGYSDADQNVEMTVKRVVLQKGAKAAASANKQTNTLAMLTSDGQSAQVQVSAADANQPEPVSSQTTVTTDDQSLAPIIDALSSAPVQDNTIQPTESVVMTTATPVARRNPPRPTQTKLLPTRLMPTNDSSTAGDDKKDSSDGEGSSKNNGNDESSTGDGSTVITATLGLTPTNVAIGDDTNTRPTWSSGDARPTSENDDGAVVPTPSGDNGDVRPTPSGDNDNTRPTPGGDDDDDDVTRPTPGGGDNGDSGRTRPTPGGDNGDSGRTRPTPGGDNGDSGRTRPTPGGDGGRTRPTRDRNGDGSDGGGDTTRNDTPDNGDGQSDAQAPTAATEDQSDRAPITKTPVPTQNVDDFWLIRQYVPPTAVLSKDDGIGALRE
jgi:hypothetical protein